MSLYPDDPSAGSPFNTGNETFGTGSGYKRGSAIRMTSHALSITFVLTLSLVSRGHTVPSPTPALEPKIQRTVLCLYLHRAPAEF